MEAQNLPDALKMIMNEKGWNQARLSKEMGVLTTWVSKVIEGQRDTPVRNAAELLGRVGYELVIRRKSDEAEVKRRAFLANVATVTLVPSADGNPYRDPEYVSLLADRVGKSLHGSGGLTTLEDATRQLRRVQSVIVGSKDRRLLSAASSLAEQVSGVHYDARDLPQARKAGKLAAAFAQLADDREQQARAFNDLSVFYCYESDGARGERYARLALATPGISPMWEAQASVSLGRALGLLHEKRHSSIVLDRVRQIAAELTDIQRAKLTGNVGVALHEQGDWKAAQETLNEAVKGISASSPLRGANYLARQVQAAFKASEPFLAIDLMHSLVRIAPLVSSARLDGYLSEIMTLSHPWKGTPAVRDMREQLRILLT